MRCPLLQRVVREYADDVPGEAIGDGHRRVLDHLAGARAIALHERQDVQLLHAECDMQWNADRIADTGIDKQPVDIRLREASIFDREVDRFCSQVFSIAIHAAHGSHAKPADCCSAVHWMRHRGFQRVNDWQPLSPTACAVPATIVEFD